MRAGITRTEFIRLLKNKILFRAFSGKYCVVFGVTKDSKIHEVTNGYFSDKGAFRMIKNLDSDWWRYDRFIIETRKLG